MSWKGTYAWKLTARDGTAKYYMPKKHAGETISARALQTQSMVDTMTASMGITVLNGSAARLTFEGVGHAGRPFTYWFRGTQWAGQVALGSATAGKWYARAYLFKRFILGPAHNLPYHYSEKYRNWAPGPNIDSSLIAPTTSRMRTELAVAGITKTRHDERPVIEPLIDRRGDEVDLEAGTFEGVDAFRGGEGAHGEQR